MVAQILGVVSLAIEAIMFIWLIVKMLIKHENLTLKDTVIYPLLITAAVIVVGIGKYMFEDATEFHVLVATSLSNAFKSVTFNMDTSMLEKINPNNFAHLLYLIAYYGVYAVVLLAFIGFALALANAFIKNAFLFNIFSKDVTYLISLTDDAKIYISSLDKKRKSQTVVLLASKTNYNYASEKLYCADHGVQCRIVGLDDKQFDKTIKNCTPVDDFALTKRTHKYTFIVFENDTNELYRLTTKIRNYAVKNNSYAKNIHFSIYSSYFQSCFIRDIINGNPQSDIHSMISQEYPLVDETRGAVTCFDKYELMAFKFVTENNFASYFPKQYQNSNGTIKDVDVNLFMIGFGKVNSYLLRDILVINQFIKIGTDKKLKLQQMNVNIYDTRKESDVDMLMLSSGICKYRKNDFPQEEYFDLPEDYYSNLKIHFETKVGDIETFNKIKSDLCEKSTKKPQINFFVISLGSDLSNLVVAKSIRETISGEENQCYNTIFARIKSEVNYRTKDAITFGANNQVLSYDAIVNNTALRRAMLQSMIYSSNKVKTNITEDNIYAEWSKIPPIRRLSNLYAIASIPFKLSCIGVEDRINLTDEEYMRRYNPHGTEINDKVDWLTQPHNSFEPYDVLAFMEHCRWNAYEMSQGVLPMKKPLPDETFGKDKPFSSKSADEMLHMNIATQDGLVEFYNTTKSYNNYADVVKYDYQLMDNYLLHRNIKLECATSKKRQKMKNKRKNKQKGQ